jgi:hypothetical protein
MQSNKFKLSPKTVVVVSIAIILLVVIIGVRQATGFHMVSTSPKLSAMPDIAPYIDVTFNRPLSAAGLTISSNPSITGAGTVSGDTLQITINKTLSTGENYTITINSIHDAKGQTLKNVALNITPINATFTSLSTNQQQAILKNQTTYAQTYNNDPILTHLPYQTLEFSLSGSYDSNAQLILYAQLYLSQSDTADESTAVNTYKQDVISYIQSLGFNSANYTIQYTVVSP